MQSVIKGGSPLNDKRCLTATLELAPSRQTVFLMFSFSGVAWRDGRGRPAPWPPTGAFPFIAVNIQQIASGLEWIQPGLPSKSEVNLLISKIPCRGGEPLAKAPG